MDQQTIACLSQHGSESSLYSLVENLSSLINPAATKRRNYIINEISSSLIVRADSLLLRKIISKIILLLNAVTLDNTIMITAKTYSDLVLVHFKESNLSNLGALFEPMRQLNEEAAHLGGFLGVTNQQGLSMTIALTFINLKKANTSYSENLVTTIRAMQRISE